MHSNTVQAGDMTKNEKRTTPSAVLRLAKIPIVRSACSLLTVYYSDTKCNHPSVKSACSLLESSVISVTSVAYDRFSPVFHKMEPQIVVVNDLTCRGLDWLENTFPMFQKPTEQLTADARSKILEVKDLMSIIGSGTMHLVQNSITWAVGKMQVQLTVGDVAVGGDRANLSLVTRMDVASRGSDSALRMSVALMEQMAPPADEKAGGVEGLEVGLVSTSRAELVASLTGHMLRSTFQSIQITLHHEHFGVTLEFSGYQAQVKQHMEELVFKSPYFMEQLLAGLISQTWSLQDLPQQIQQQLMSAVFFVSQMYTLIYAIREEDMPPLRPTSPKTALNGTPVKHLSPGNSPVLPQTSSNGKHRKRHVKIPSPNASNAAREIVFK
ncbi:unnamed protein product [Lota lota]